MDCKNFRARVWFPFCASVCGDIALLWQLAIDFTDPKIFLILFVTTGFAFVTVMYGYHYPFVRFAEDGVYIRPFFRKVKYEWQDFIQVGVARPPEKWRKFSLIDGLIYMLLPGAVKHNPSKDFGRNSIMDAFVWRNRFRMFIISAETEEEILEYILKHYGDLDFEVIQYGRNYLD